VEIWQLVLLAFFVLLPMTLLVGFWPERERLSSAGAPIDRTWKRQIVHEPAEDDHH
jgi:hypothetical protein